MLRDFGGDYSISSDRSCVYIVERVVKLTIGFFTAYNIKIAEHRTDDSVVGHTSTHIHYCRNKNLQWKR